MLILWIHYVGRTRKVINHLLIILPSQGYHSLTRGHIRDKQRVIEQGRGIYGRIMIVTRCPSRDTRPKKIKCCRGYNAVKSKWCFLGFVRFAYLSDVVRALVSSQTDSGRTEAMNKIRRRPGTGKAAAQGATPASPPRPSRQWREFRTT